MSRFRRLLTAVTFPVLAGFAAFGGSTPTAPVLIASHTGIGHAHAHLQASQAPLKYYGGTDGTGVQVHPKVYLVFWGKQWGTEGHQGSDVTFSNDVFGAAPYVQDFLRGLFGSQDTWSTSTTQYCQGIAKGAITCPASATHVTHPASSPLAGVWADIGANQPPVSTNKQLGQEADRAAVHFGNATPASNTSVQYVIVSPSGLHPGGYGLPGSLFCAWHDFTRGKDIGVYTARGDIAFTNLPYQNDQGPNCGQGFVNTPGLRDGWSIVEGHEYGETITDFFPQAPVGATDLTSGGWFEPTKGENGDKCAWITPGTPGGAKNIHTSTGTFAVQSLWSNNYKNNAGGCVSYYKDASHQGG